MPAQAALECCGRCFLDSFGVSLEAGGYTFGINKADDHSGLLTAQKAVSLQPFRWAPGECLSHFHGWQLQSRPLEHGSASSSWSAWVGWQVLGDQEIPQSGRSYWEVKFVKKPANAFEFIGLILM